MSQWSEPVVFSDTEDRGDQRWTMTVVFQLSSPTFQAADDGALIHGMKVTDRRYFQVTTLETDATAALERRLTRFIGRPLVEFAEFLNSLQDVVASIDYQHDEADNPIARAAQATHLAKTEQATARTAEQDAADYGTGFEVDGQRVAPSRVRVFTRSAPRG